MPALLKIGLCMQMVVNGPIITAIGNDSILLPPTPDDDTDIAFRMHDTHTHPLLQENRSFGGLRIRFNLILHQQEGEQSFQFLLSEMPS